MTSKTHFTRRSTVAIQALIQEGLEHFKANRLADAEVVYNRILKRHPNNPTALYLLGHLFHQKGQNGTALEWFGKAIALAPKEPLFLNDLGIVYYSMGKLEEAIACYRQALAIRPTYYMSLSNLGNALYDVGQTEEALVRYQEAVAAQPDSSEAHNNLGNALLKEGRFDEAIAAYQKAIEINPVYLGPYNNMGAALEAQGKMEEAIAICQRALAIQPSNYEVYQRMGGILFAQGKTDESIACYKKALDIKPDSQAAHNNLGNVLLNQGRLQEAVRSYQKALDISPNMHEASNNLGAALQELGEREEAMACYRRALAAKPDYGPALTNLGAALDVQGRVDEAIECYKKAIEVAPDDPDAHGSVLHLMLMACDWRSFTSRYERMITVFRAQQKPVKPFTFLSLHTTPAEQLKCATLYVRDKYAMLINLAATRQYDVNPNRIKIAYLSGDFQNHPVAYLTAELFELHDRSRFEVTAYSYGKNDGREMRQRIMKSVDHFIDLHPLTYEAAAQKIFDDGIHILVELNGFTNKARLQIPAMRPAPIQVSWLGYLGTSGSHFIDYILSDHFITPSGYEENFSEKIVRLPECFQPNDRQLAVPQSPTRRERGLPEQGFIFASFNKSYKFNAETFDIWMNLLRQTQGSLLWLFATNHWAEANLRREAEERGVASDRIFFMPFMDQASYLANYRLADLILDTYPYNSGTTASNALWAGCPMVTCTGHNFVSRQAGSLLITVGMPELVTHSLTDYEALALALANDPIRLANIRQRLQDNLQTSPLFNTPRFTRHLESAFEAMWQRFRSGQQPDHIFVPKRPPDEFVHLAQGVPAEPNSIPVMAQPVMSPPAVGYLLPKGLAQDIVATDYVASDSAPTDLQEKVDWVAQNPVRARDHALQVMEAGHAKIHLHHIANSRETYDNVEAGYRILDNTENIRPDWQGYWPMRKFLLNVVLDDSAYYGFFSPKFREKTGLQYQQVIEYVQKSYDADIVLFSPQPDMGAFFLNSFEQQELFDPGFIEVSEVFLKQAGFSVSLATLIMDSRQIVFSNYFVARPKFWRVWFGLTEMLFAICEGPDTALRQALLKASNYPGEVQRKVFLLERLASLLLVTDSQWKVHAYNTFACAWSDSRLNQFKLEAVLSDALKIAMQTQGFSNYREAFASLRDRLR